MQAKKLAVVSESWASFTKAAVDNLEDTKVTHETPSPSPPCAQLMSSLPCLGLRAFTPIIIKRDYCPSSLPGQQKLAAQKMEAATLFAGSQ